MEGDYNRFRFRNRDLYRTYSEKMVRFVFEQVSFFLEYFGDGNFSNRELHDFVNESAKSCGLMLPDDSALVNIIMDYFCGELGFCRTFRNNYPVVHDLVSAVVSDHVEGGSKFIDPLSRSIIDEFDRSSYSTTMDEIVSRLKMKAELRFIPSGLIHDAVNSVYEFFAKQAEGL